MDWIFEHLNVIIVVAGAIAYWINQRAREKAGQEADYDEDGVPENRPGRTREMPAHPARGADFDQEERNRRIREEIQRKIAERRGQGAPSAPPPMPPPRLDPFRPVFREEVAPPPPPLRPEPAPMPPPMPAPAAAYEDASALERQRRLAEQLQELEEQRREARRQAERARGQLAAPALAAASIGGAPVGSRSVAAELRDPRALRRAFVLREVLAAPVGLR